MISELLKTGAGQLTVGGFFATLVLIIVFQFLREVFKKSKEGSDVVLIIQKLTSIEGIAKKTHDNLNLIKSQTHDLHTWHNINDSDGVKIWYNRRSLEEAIKSLADNICTQTKVLERLVRDVENQDKDVKELDKRLERMSEKLSYGT